MMDISKWGLNNRKLIYFLVAVLVIGGIFGLQKMSKLEDPEIKIKIATVVAIYPGATAHQVELEVTDPLEKAIRTMDNLNIVDSRSTDDMALLQVELTPDTPDDEIEQYWDMLRRKVRDIAGNMPSSVRLMVKDDFNKVYGLFYAVTNDGYTQREFNDFVDLAQREITNVNGVARVEIYGKHKECINIKLDEKRMAHLGVLPVEVLMTLNGQNATVYSGYYLSGDKRIRVNIDGRYRNLQDIKDLLIQGHENDQIKLNDIADIEDGYETPVRNSMTFDGADAVGFSISAQSGSDITKVGAAVEKRLEQLQNTQIPEGITFHKVFFQSDRVKESLSAFAINLIESIIIVIAILMLTMGIRSGNLMGICLVITVMGTFLILEIQGGMVQRVSVGAFILAMGMLVDNAIVIIDGILTDLQSGKPREEALTAIGRKTAMPLLGATFIAILAFYPIYLSPDTAGVYVRDLFVVLAVSLLLSWVLALTFVPIMADRMLKKMPAKKNEELYQNIWYRMLNSCLSWALRHRLITVGGAIGLLIVSFFGYKLIPQGFFPDMSYNQLYIEYNMPEGTSSDRVAQDLKKIGDHLRQQENIDHVTTSVGGTPSRYNLVRSIAQPSLAYGELIVDYTSQKELIKDLPALQKYLTNNYPEAFVRAKRYNLMYKPFQIEVQFDGPDPAILRNLTHQAEEIMRNEPKVRLIRNNWEQPMPVLNVHYNQPVSRTIGLSRKDVGTSVLAATDGIPIGTIYDGTNAKTMYVKCTENGKPMQNISNTPIFGTSLPIQNISRDMMLDIIQGTKSQQDILEGIIRTVPLSQTADSISIDWEEPVVRRYNGQRSMRAQCDAALGVSVETARQAIAKKIEAIPLPKGYTRSWQGEYYASQQSTNYLFANYPLAVILMLAILIMLFKDYKKPAIILCSIPLLFIGVVLGFLVSGKTFGFVAIVGTLGLIGMMIKNGVVLMDEITLQISSGKEPVQALLDSSASRLRPVMMASMTTILGVIPLLTDDLFGALAITIMGGLFVGTIITLIIIPTLYALFFKIKATK